MSSTGNVKNKTKESLVLQHVRSSYCSGHSCQAAVLFETDKSASNMAASVIYNKSEDAIPFIGMQGPFEKSPMSSSCCLQMPAVFQGVNANTAHLAQQEQEETCFKFHHKARDDGEMIWDKEAISFC